MNIRVEATRFDSLKTPFAVFPLTEEATSAIKLGKKTTLAPITKRVKACDFKGETGDTTLLYDPTPGMGRLLLVGLGKEKELTIEKYRRAGNTGVHHAKRARVQSLHVVAQPYAKVSEQEAAVALAEGLLLGGYDFDRYKTEEKEKRKPVKDATLVLGLLSTKIRDAVARAVIVCSNTLYVRDLMNESTSKMSTLDIAREAVRIGKKPLVRCKVYDEKALKKLKCNLLLGVGAGSKFPARMIVLDYVGNPGSKDTIALVGKGITFDSGGLNLKPTGYLETMRMDKGGAMTVLATIKCLAELKAKVNVVGVMGMAENMIGPGAQKPGDVVIGYAGKSVEIGNTDAEGRLVLGDCLAFVEKQYKPKAIVDLATLTGAVLVVLSEYGAGLVSTDDKLANALETAGTATGERVWRLPLYEEFLDDVKSDIADVRNVGHPKGYGGTVTAAAFLRKFVGETPWAHLDIAGTAWAEKPRHYIQRGATGYGVRLLVEWLTR
ncbi:MAG: leucyl aminopeptidase [Nanoarchaeota archaeon]|nr:leucyl aminopeptidase [Nanoarchaeota archaeon]